MQYYTIYAVKIELVVVVTTITFTKASPTALNTYDFTTVRDNSTNNRRTILYN